MSLNEIDSLLNLLEQQASVLEPDLFQRQQVQSEVEQYVQTFLSQLPQRPSFVVTPDKGIKMLDSPISENSISIQEALQLLNDNVDTPGLNPASPRHMGYIPGGGLYYSGLGDYLAAVTNKYAGLFYSAPGAVRMENMLLRWMAGIIGFPEDAAGNLASGGSIATLIALATARDAMGVKARQIPDSVVYMSAQAHHCLEKALRIAGLGECPVRILPMDAQYRLQPEALEHAITADQKAGLRPWLLIATAGTTDVGAIDPLLALSSIAKKHGLWYHVDAAYGGFFALAPSGKEKLSGIEQADSVVLDPHKGLFVPFGLGAVLIKNKAQMAQTHHYQANYMQDTLSATEEASPADLSPELTKHFRGLRLWLPLKLHGVAPFRSALEEKLLLAQYVYQRLCHMPNVEVPVEPELSVVVFRVIPSSGADINTFNQKLSLAVQQDGRVFLSSTKLQDSFMLRFAILSFRTHKETLDLALQILQEKAAELEANWQA
ncbi:pyridoxal phosphate-dependent decarboxylase family protein [Rufibacter roseus]|nr:aminotransferase class V-fold PLP-dependent enzyme [Rufibacter roseus]